MATNNTWLWIAAAGVAIYLYEKNKTDTTTANAQTTTPAAAAPIVSQVPTPLTISNLPVSAAAVNNAPPGQGQLTDVTNLVPMAPTGLATGQTLAVNNNQTPVTNSSGTPLVFTPTLNPGNMKPSYLILLSGTDRGECL